MRTAHAWDVLMLARRDNTDDDPGVPILSQQQMECKWRYHRQAGSHVYVRHDTTLTFSSLQQPPKCPKHYQLPRQTSKYKEHVYKRYK